MINLDIVWVLLAGVLVFFMQAGFAMVETGFTRAKNASNIIMKNLMDFSIGSIAFYIIGFGIMFGADYFGVIGVSGFFKPESVTTVGAFETLTPGTFIFFQTVFAATAATIVSGAMAERTKFISYVIYSCVISLFIYPVVGHWIWGGGWLSSLSIGSASGMVDFAGSTVVHSVGGWAALIGAALLGPRIGKYTSDGKVHAFPGHNITLGALGVFILWFGWFGFNPGSTLAANGEIGYIAMTTNLAAAAGACTVMIITWIRYKKPDVSLTLNGVLGGLVAITAGCEVVTFYGAILIGAIAGFIVVFGVEFLDKKLKIDDPVGAVSVHGFCGATGTLMVGLLANYPTNITGEASEITGLFYGGGLSQFAVQLVGVAAVAAWTMGTAFILFSIIKHTVGLRVSKEEEISGLDLEEHNSQAYADFMIKT